MYRDLNLFIGGDWRAASDKATKAVADPATEEVLGTIAVATPDDVEAALAAAKEGFEVWRKTGTWDRAAKIRKVADLIRERQEHIARLMSLETGKPLAEAMGETGAAADQFEWYAEETKRIYGQMIEARAGQPHGGDLSAGGRGRGLFGLELSRLFLPARKMAAALAAGCAIIVKPAGETPACCAALVQACQDAGIPSGVVNMVTGNSGRIAEHLIRSPIVRKVSVTGSVPVGKQILKLWLPRA